MFLVMTIVAYAILSQHNTKWTRYFYLHIMLQPPKALLYGVRGRQPVVFFVTEGFFSHQARNVSFYTCPGHMIMMWCFEFLFNTLRPIQNSRHFPDDSFKCIFLNENIGISIKISLKFAPKGPMNNIASLVQIMAWSSDAYMRQWTNRHRFI